MIVYPLPCKPASSVKRRANMIAGDAGYGSSVMSNQFLRVDSSSVGTISIESAFAAEVRALDVVKHEG